MKIRIQKSDVLFSLLVRERAEFKCERCGKFYPEGQRQGLHCSHLIGRRNKAVRWSPLNAVAHCFFCHKYLTENPIEFHRWITNHLTPAQFTELTLLAMKPIRLDAAMKKHIERNLNHSLALMNVRRCYGETGRIEFASPYEGEVQPIKRRSAKKAKTGAKKTGRKIQSPGFDKTKTVKLRTREVVERKPKRAA